MPSPGLRDLKILLPWTEGTAMGFLTRCYLSLMKQMVENVLI